MDLINKCPKIVMSCLEGVHDWFVSMSPKDCVGWSDQGQCFEIQSFRLPDGLTLSNGTLEVVEGMHIQESEGIKLCGIGIIGVESGVRLIDSDIQMER